MILRHLKSMFRLLTALVFFFSISGWLQAAPTGPTLHFDYGNGRPLENPLDKFMYFVPLISPDPIAVSTNAGNTQCARVISCECRTNGTSFHALCKFELTGQGLQQNVFDHAEFIRRHEQDLRAGKKLLCQLDAINVQGAGSGSVEIKGTLTDDRITVTEVRLRFNGDDRISPVIIWLHNISYHDGAIHLENEQVAKVNMLTFNQKSGRPKMEVTLASVKPKAAANSLWQNFLGRVKGMVANLLIPPLNVPADGHQAMMDFGLALAMKNTNFTFPFAIRLKTVSPAALNTSSNALLFATKPGADETQRP